MKVPTICNIFNEKSTNFTGQFATTRLDIVRYDWTVLCISGEDRQVRKYPHLFVFCQRRKCRRNSYRANKSAAMIIVLNVMITAAEICNILLHWSLIRLC